MKEGQVYNLLNRLSLYIYNKEIYLNPGFGYLNDSQDEYVYSSALITDEEHLHMIKIYTERDRFYSRENFRDCINTTFRIVFEDYLIIIIVDAQRRYKYKDFYNTNNLETEDITFKMLMAINDYETDKQLFRHWNVFSTGNDKKEALEFFSVLEQFFDKQAVIDEGFIYVSEVIDYINKYLY